jgi:hypothetical protein
VRVRIFVRWIRNAFLLYLPIICIIGMNRKNTNTTEIMMFYVVDNKFSLRALLNTVSDLKGLIIGAFSEEIINS